MNMFSIAGFVYEKQQYEGKSASKKGSEQKEQNSKSPSDQNIGKTQKEILTQTKKSKKIINQLKQVRLEERKREAASRVALMNFNRSNIRQEHEHN